VRATRRSRARSRPEGRTRTERSPLDAAKAAPRRAALDWQRIEAALDERGFALPGRVLPARECTQLRRLFDRSELFRSTIEMEPRSFGHGRYRYFAYPLPPVVEALREAFYAPLAAIANRWQERLGRAERFEPSLAAFLARCHAAGQTRPTPLLLRYETGGYNRLHQDLYGALAFPFQVTIVLSREDADYRGGEFLLTEQRARMQSRATALRLGLGEAVIFPNAVRPVAGPRGWTRGELRHGVSELWRGERLALGLIFHDAS
jgi:hypothetical protein